MNFGPRWVKWLSRFIFIIINYPHGMSSFFFFFFSSSFIFFFFFSSSSHRHSGLPSTFVPHFHDEASVRRMRYNKLGSTGMDVAALSIGGGGEFFFSFFFLIFLNNFLIFSWTFLCEKQTP